MKVLLKHWKYKNLTFVAVGMILTLLLSKLSFFHQFITSIGSFGYFGAFLGGMLFVSTFTVSTGALLLVEFSKNLNPVTLSLIAGLGAVFGNIVIFKLVKDNLYKEIKEIYDEDFNGKHISRILHTKYFHWLMPVIGAMIIASPLPDEAGITLMGIAKMSMQKFVLLSFTLNTIGIFTAISIMV